jgi:pimeloyl-ACP methyl ester carboxylesterase
MTTSSATEGPLPRRAFLGAQLAPDAEAFSEAGVLVVGVVEGGMAMAADVQPGDRLAKLADHPLRSLREMSAALRAAGRCSTTELEIIRADKVHRAEVAVKPCPKESIEGQHVSYETLSVDGARLRCIITRPKDGNERGAILFLQGIACESVDYGTASDEPMARLVHGWAAAGYVTMRVDKRGVGDSEGPCCGLGDFETELADHREALDYLFEDERFGDLDIFLFGHSIGGMVAPILAQAVRVQGLMVYGTSTVNWLDCVVASTRRQFELRGVDADEIDSILGTLRERVARSGLNGRGADYHRQLNELDLRSIWKQLDQQMPVLVLCGENDWVLSRAEQLEIGSLMPKAECLDLPGLDHMLGWHASREESLQAYGQGVFRDEILSGTLEWLAKCGLQSRS